MLECERTGRSMNVCNVDCGKLESPGKFRGLQLDRFVPRRSAMDMEASRYLLLSDDSSMDDDIINKDKVQLRREALRLLLEKMMFPEGLPNKVLLLSISSRNPASPRPETWPARPRSRPCISSPDSILDLPAFDPSINLNILDWGSGGVMAASLQHSVFLCDLSTSSTERLTTFSTGRSTCVQWDPLGDRLAVANDASEIQVWDSKEKKLIGELECYCSEQRLSTKCSVNALAWHPRGTHFASGCSWGTIIAFPFPEVQGSSPCLVVRAHRGAIAILRSSPDGRYVASSGTDNALRVWLWPDLRPHMEIASHDDHVPALAWHPWQSCYLAIGSHCLAVYNVNSAALLTRQDFNRHHVTIYSLAWNPLTAELVVSLWVHGDEAGEVEDHAEVLVLATANQIVDRLQIHSNVGKVHYLMWAPDGKKIATAGGDETLQVWNFIKDASTTNKKRRSSQDFGFVIR